MDSEVNSQNDAVLHSFISFSSDEDENSQLPKVYDRFYDSSSSEPEDEHSNNDAVQKRIDYMIQYLDRKLESNSIDQESYIPSSSEGLEEFVATGGGLGMFRLPLRAAVHPDRPPSLELRPHPLREGEICCALRALEAVDDGRQLWAGFDCGIRVFDLKDMYKPGEEVYWESEGCAPTICLAGDHGNGVVWSGHRDGRVRCWRMEVNRDGFREEVSWQAHRAPVLSMVITSYGNCK